MGDGPIALEFCRPGAVRMRQNSMEGIRLCRIPKRRPAGIGSPAGQRCVPPRQKYPPEE
jgi:hypothetical protein